MKIAVIGSCQVFGIGDALSHLLDGCEISPFFVGELNGVDIPRIEATLAECDIVFSQDINDERCGSLRTDNLRKEIENLTVLPVIAFTGFQPDCVYILADGGPYCSPLSVYNSAIIAASYSLELAADHAARLFNKLIFKRLGYFDEFPKALAHLEWSMKEYGIDIAAELPGWMASGAFMHTINHPKACVLASVARLLAVNAGLVSAQTPTPELSYDHLASSVGWPVFPELAQSLGLRGDYIFKRRDHDLSIGERALISLQDFVQGSYDRYCDIPLEAFNSYQIAKVRNTLLSVLSGE